MAITNKSSINFYTNGLTTDYNSLIRPANRGDLGCDTTLKILRVGDGQTYGGIPIPTSQNFFSQVTTGGAVTLGNHYVYFAVPGATDPLSTVTLPAPDASSVYHGAQNFFYGRRYIIARSNTGAHATNNIIVTSPSGLIATLTTTVGQPKSIEVISNGSAWVILNTLYNI